MTRYWIIDHKTDKQANIKKHLTQLEAYGFVLGEKRPVKGLAINWIRTGLIEMLQKS